MQLMKVRTLVAAVFGFLAVALGAFGAHALKATLGTHDMTGTWETASKYHLVHAVLLWVLATVKPSWKWPFWSILVGICLFSGSLYILCLKPECSVMGPITPIGGLFLLLGWLSLGFSGWKESQNS